MARIAVVLLVAVGCTSPEGRKAPSWFPLGDEVYHARDRTAQQATVLAFQPDSRWFEASPRIAYPANLEDVPRVSGGASLSLAVHATDDPAVLRIDLRLEGGERQVWREIEHRWTNTLPFLFGFYVDGEPIRMTCEGIAKFGGVASFVPVVAAAEQRLWSVRVDVASIEALLGRSNSVEIVAVFAERQHIGYMGESAMLLDRDLKPPFDSPLVLRSNLARLSIPPDVR